MDLEKQISENDYCLIGCPNWQNDFKIPITITNIVNNQITLLFDRRFISIIEDLKQNETIQLFKESESECTVFEGITKSVDVENLALIITLEKDPHIFVNRRSYFRITDTFPVLCKKIDGHEVERIKGSLTKSPSSKRIVNHKIRALWNKVSSLRLSASETEIFHDILKIMEHTSNKLDAIVNGSVIDGNLPKPVEVNISGSGFRFRSEEAFQEGEYLHVLLNLPFDLSVRIEGVGQVVSCKKENSQPSINGYDTAVRFVYINEVDRAEIIKYTFFKQREFLRPREIIDVIKPPSPLERS